MLHTAKSDFDSWGVRLNGTGKVNSFQNRWELHGKEKEMTFNLNRVNFGARVYNPTIGRWDKIDPLADHPNQVGVSPYSSSNNNPVNLKDDDGRIPVPVITGIIGAVAKGGIELGSQLMAKNFEFSKVDWADVGIEAMKGGLIGSGIGTSGAALLEVGGIALKASVDVTLKDGVNTTFDGSKSVKEAAFDATADAVGGKVFGKMGKSVTGSLESSAKKLTAEATTANRAASIAKSYAQETGKVGAKTYAGNLAKEATVATAKQKVVSTAAQVSKSPAGEVVKGTYQNKLTDAVKEIFKNF